MKNDDTTIQTTLGHNKKDLADAAARLRKKTPLEPFFVLMTGSERGKKFILVSASTLIGRSPQCNIRIEDPKVSVRHAEVIKQDDNFMLKDLDSSNGTWINGKRLKGADSINNGDRIYMGSQELLFSVPDTGDGSTR